MSYNTLGSYGDGTVRVEMFTLGVGCPENCADCGAFSSTKDLGDLRTREVSRRRIDQCIMAVIKATRNNVFPPYVTTNVQQEPLAGDAFFHFMRRIKRLTDGKTRAICISHGLRTAGDGRIIDKEAEDRLLDIVAFMDERDIFILSFDAMRSGGKIDEAVNIASYVETLDRLRPVVKKGARVTISIQGIGGVLSSDPLSRRHSYDALAVVMGKLGKEKGWSFEEIGRFNKDNGRRVVKVGRAAEKFPWLDDSSEATVIPDAEVVKGLSDGGHLSHSLRGNMDCVTGQLRVKVNNPTKTYRDTVTGLWEEMSLGGIPLGRAVLYVVRSGRRRVRRVLCGSTGGFEGEEILDVSADGSHVAIDTGVEEAEAVVDEGVAAEGSISGQGDEAKTGAEAVDSEGGADNSGVVKNVGQESSEGGARTGGGDADDTREGEAVEKLNDPGSSEDEI